VPALVLLDACERPPTLDTAERAPAAGWLAARLDRGAVHATGQPWSQQLVAPACWKRRLSRPYTLGPAMCSALRLRDGPLTTSGASTELGAGVGM
jgi:hypothetical protein